MFISKGKLSEDLRGKPYRYFSIDNLAKCSNFSLRLLEVFVSFLQISTVKFHFLRLLLKERLSKLPDVYKQWGSATS